MPPNTGTILRLCACLGVAVDIIEPCGFPLSDRSLKRAAMDYMARAEIVRHSSWAGYRRQPPAGRLVVLSTKAAVPYTEFAFATDDTLLLGQESSGLPENIHRAADARVRIPMRAGLRSLNVAVAAAMVLGEALRQTAGFPTTEPGSSP